MKRTNDGLYYKITQEGTGSIAVSGQGITAAVIPANSLTAKFSIAIKTGRGQASNLHWANMV